MGNCAIQLLSFTTNTQIGTFNVQEMGEVYCKRTFVDRGTKAQIQQCIRLVFTAVHCISSSACPLCFTIKLGKMPGFLLKLNKRVIHVLLVLRFVPIIVCHLCVRQNSYVFKIPCRRRLWRGFFPATYKTRVSCGMSRSAWNWERGERVM